MTMPATPMNEAAERYSPEMADAFQPTDTARPATKKSDAVLDFRADQNPIQMVATTVKSEKQRIQGSVRFSISATEVEPSAKKGARLIAGLARVEFPFARGPENAE